MRLELAATECGPRIASVRLVSISLLALFAAFSVDNRGVLTGAVSCARIQLQQNDAAKVIDGVARVAFCVLGRPRDVTLVGVLFKEAAGRGQTSDWSLSMQPPSWRKIATFEPNRDRP